MKRFFIASAIIATLVSCKKHSSQNSQERQLSADIDLTITGKTKATQPLYEASTTYNFLGFGYDVTDKFNDELSVRASVVDVPKFVASSKYNVDVSTSTETSWTVIDAENAERVSAKLSNTLQATRGTQLFGNTFSSAFPNISVDDDKYVYGYYSYYTIRKRMRFYYDQKVNNFLSNDFKRDVNVLDAQALVAKYGTHVMAGVKVGAKFDVFYQSESADGDRYRIAREGFRYALKKTFGLHHGYLDDVNLEDLHRNTAPRIYYSAIGGDLTQLTIQLVKDKPFLNISNWKNSATEDNIRFIGISEDRLEPLSSFIEDLGKKAAVETYLAQYLKRKTVKMID